MLFATVGQGALFIWMMLAGVAIGAWYALMALVRRIIRAGFLRTLACDLLFGLGCAAILILFMVLGNYGQVRLFSILGTVLGLLIFFFALAGPLKRMLSAVEGAGKRIWTRLSKNRLINVIFK